MLNLPNSPATLTLVVAPSVSMTATVISQSLNLSLPITVAFHPFTTLATFSEPRPVASS